MKKQGLLGRRLIGQAGVEQTYDTYLRGRDGPAQLTRRLAGQPTSRSSRRCSPQPGNTLRLTIDIGLQRAAEQALRDGIHDARATPDGSRVPTAARSWRSTRTTARSSRWRRTRPTSRRSSPAATRRSSRRSRTRRPPQTANFPASTARSRSSIRRARRSSRSRRWPRWRSILHARTTSLPCTPTYHDRTGRHVQELGPVRRPADGPGRRRSPSPATRTSTSSATSFYQLPASRGQPLQAWASRFGFGKPTGIDIGPESAGPDADARVAAQGLHAARQGHGRSTASGSRATRSSSRSARATCS